MKIPNIDTLSRKYMFDLIKLQFCIKHIGSVRLFPISKKNHLISVIE